MGVYLFVTGLLFAAFKFTFLVLKRTGLWVYLTLFPGLALGWCFLGAWIGIAPENPSPFRWIYLVASETTAQEVVWTNLLDWTVFWAFLVTTPLVVLLFTRTIIRVMCNNPQWTYRAAIRNRKGTPDLTSSNPSKTKTEA